MIFNSFSYFLFFLLPASLLFRVASPKFRPWICTASGALFFVYYSVAGFGGWLGAACLLFLFWEALVSRLYEPRSRFCVAGVALGILILAVFKYWNFFTGAVFAPWGRNPLGWKGAFLPLGVSFFTFEVIHYAVDRYRGKAPKGTLGDYLAFLFFFPTMVAGPIKRYQDFVPSLHAPSTDWPLDWNRGITRILTGLVKKFAVADVLTSFTDHLRVEDITRTSRPFLLLWLFAYGWKIYFDFSAYSDIAIGSGRLFGMKIPENFDWPYLRTNIAEFWRHWHMSLTRWLTDYVFIPLGGSRGGSARTCANLFVVMCVSGLWHGAGFNFIAWGMWHGLLLVIHRAWSDWRGPVTAAGWPGRFAGWLVTYVSVNVGWAFFAMDLRTAGIFFGRLIWG